MRLITTIKPQIFTAITKEELMRKMTVGKVYTISTILDHNFSGWTDDKYKYAMNFEKRRKKSKLIGRQVQNKRKIIQEKEWIGRLYHFDKDFPITIKQHPRYFDYTY